MRSEEQCRKHFKAIALYLDNENKITKESGMKPPKGYDTEKAMLTKEIIEGKKEVERLWREPMYSEQSEEYQNAAKKVNKLIREAGLITQLVWNGKKEQD